MNSRYVLLFFIVQLLTPIRRTIEKDILLKFSRISFFVVGVFFVGFLLGEDVGCHGSEGGGEDAFFHLQLLVGYCVAIFAVLYGYWYCHCGFLLVEVDDDGGFFASLNNDLLAVVAEDDVLGQVGVDVAELIDGTHHWVLEFVVAYFANLVVAPVVVACATVGA